MNSRWLIRISAALTGVVLAGVVLQGFIAVQADVYAGAYAPLAKAWKELVLMIAAVPLAVAITQQRAWGQFVRQPLCWGIIALALLHGVIMAVYHHPPGSEFAGLVIDLRGYLAWLVAYALVYLHPQVLRSLLIAAGVGAGCTVGFAVLQVTVLPVDFLAQFGYSKATIAPYLTVDLNDSFVRINSFLRGPNPLGAYSVLLLCVAVAYGIRHWWRLRAMQRGLLGAVVIGSLVALIWSYSRSAWLGAVVAGVVLAASYVPRRFVAWLGVVLVVTTCVGGVVVYSLRQTPFISNVVFHNNAGAGSVHKSDDGHADSLRHAAQVVGHHPQGVGVGSTGSPSLGPGATPHIIENQYLYMAHETGWLGLGVQLAITAGALLLLWRARRSHWLARALLAAGAGLLTIGLVLPVWADDTVVITWWLLAGALAGWAAAAHGRLAPTAATNTV